jgi:cell division protein FtsA
LSRALNPSWLYAREDSERKIIHTIPIAYSVDENTAIRDPRGMYGEKLGVNMHVVSVAKSAERNLGACINRCRLGIEARATAPYASGLACLVEDEKKLGAVVIDMGGGTTTLAVFVDGAVVHTDCIPLGGDQVTNDIARGLSAPLSFAERTKALYGSAIPSPSDDNEILTVPLVGEEELAEANRIPRSMLVGIIRPRVEEIFEIVRTRLETTGFDRIAGRRVVLTGGASQLTGIRELASGMLDKQVRLGRPMGRPGGLKGLPEAAGGPAFATCAGLVEFALLTRAEAPRAAPARSKTTDGYVTRFGYWVRENVLPSLSPLRGG